jgi:hypothetical protein
MEFWSVGIFITPVLQYSITPCMAAKSDVTLIFHSFVTNIKIQARSYEYVRDGNHRIH